MNILISGCLMGMYCRYDGKTKCHDKIDALMKKHTLIPVCPEIMGGLPTPRPAAEIRDNRVINKACNDVTNQFKKGATEVLRLARLYDCSTVILKERSPSCGSNQIYDGSFTGKLIQGDGITAALLKKEGICVIGESDIDLLLS